MQTEKATTHRREPWIVNDSIGQVTLGTDDKAPSSAQQSIDSDLETDDDTHELDGPGNKTEIMSEHALTHFCTDEWEITLTSIYIQTIDEVRCELHAATRGEV